MGNDYNAGARIDDEVFFIGSFKFYPNGSIRST